MFGFVHPRAIIFGLLIVLGGGGRSLHKSEICFGAQVFLPREHSAFGGGHARMCSSAKFHVFEFASARNARNARGVVGDH